ncbi:hydroxyisourate hydrolase [Enterobacter ludwigii]|jgi:hydroxyisourate hydrolase|uniref:5-hydroxyisourate hydrolase n=1 Tax=Enterobacter cloacae TaxID=550 RepID=A0A411IU97_ENTCL|nr:MULTISPECIES: hydroxyisourate hydrolase [Enterobacterales]MCF8579367.1 hydroxyisourate hydrolase [Enterobacter ludwigii]MCQ4445442.1 hydroxyisourate hydrolase [Enterobacter cloacae]MDW2869524.1 hydroxyisourate hydrolase [Enterobacter hormaechei]NJQ19763.1 hydroxyisourate hydrolase [Pantoea sp. LS15]NKF46359.1 hydroxyisourate hydrolase [Pantoea sp. LS15]
MSTLSTHILDISTGKPAQGVTVHLQQEGKTLATDVTNAQGRITTFVPFLPAGRYRLVAEIGEWFRETGRDTLYPCAQIDFVTGGTAEEHFHLPFVIAPGGWSTYRGS